MAFTTTTGANGVVSLVGTSGVDADAAIIYSSMVSIEGFGDNDIIGVRSATGQTFVSEFTIIGGQGNDSISVTNTALVNSAIWGDTIETVDGNQIVGSGTDTITVGIVQNSTILGLGGADTITTGGLNGADINGNAGIDTITVRATAADAGGVTTTFVRGGQQDDVLDIETGVLVSTHINGNKGSDDIKVTASGVIADTTVYGGQGNDLITLTSNGDFGFVASGDIGNDVITGSIQNDTINGGEGNDAIDGDKGADSLTGDSGADSFTQNIGDSVAATRYVAATATTKATLTFGNGVDVITDFAAGTAAAPNDTITTDFAATVYQGTWNGSTFTNNGLAGGAGVSGSAYLVVNGTIADATTDSDSFIVIGSAPVFA